MDQRDARTTRAPLVLLVIAIVAALAAVIQDFRFDRSLTLLHTEAIATEREIGSAELALANFRGAETAYLATGQGPEFWMRQAADLADALQGSLSRLHASASPAARAHFDESAAALNDLLALDKRARADVQADQRFLAADLVFADALDPSQRLETALASGRTAEAAATDARLNSTRNLRLGMNAGVLVLLIPAIAAVIRRPKPQQAPASPAAEVAQMLRDLPPPVKAQMPAAPRPAPAAPAPPPVLVNLPEAADLCVDLARVIDDRDVPALLERAAHVLEAKGLIIWVADRAGLTLRPAMTHGYPDKVLQRLGALQASADNVTSLSFRSSRPQTMNGSTPGAPAAIAVPLVTASGCAGVLAAEIRDSKPATETLAVAKIIAAQFATLIAPIDVPDTKTAQA